ncbi:hypothetical protein [Ktedonospora formicarum]|uniref:Uncharacterized protein n=1 Tax=Ktedonospora formicarum TaxID=2778364 RepID=A0A8J3MWA2_9CHLR|nr:hypothetical protein [Ktedonospora formicarum]GHO47360.1 hypothetical protein KSX_55230 [Ktedonospora formicarum]
MFAAPLDLPAAGLSILGSLWGASLIPARASDTRYKDLQGWSWLDPGGHHKKRGTA